MAPPACSDLPYFARSALKWSPFTTSRMGAISMTAAVRCIRRSCARKSSKRRSALGVAFDGDADRAMFVSASGRHVDGDGVLLAAARYFKSLENMLRGGRVIGTTMANLGLERILEVEGLSLARMPVGDRYVLEEMLRSGANLGGEQSGHIIFLDDATTGDGLLTALKIACLVALRGPLDELVQRLEGVSSNHCKRKS